MNSGTLFRVGGIDFEGGENLVNQNTIIENRSLYGAGISNSLFGGIMIIKKNAIICYYALDYGGGINLSVGDNKKNY